MLINLLPDFFAVLDSTDRLAAYQHYFAQHRKILEPYWNNYVIDPDSAHFADIDRQRQSRRPENDARAHRHRVAREKHGTTVP
jgi:hypothetical protein